MYAKTLILLLFSTSFLSAQESKPCYQLRLKSEEYPLFSQSVFSGIYDKGGKLEYSTQIQKERTGLYVHLNICDRKMAEEVQFQLSQEVLKVLGAASSLETLNQQEKWKLNALQAINRKLSYALKNPARPELRLNGLVQKEGQVVFLSTLDKGNLLLTNRQPQILDNWLGKEVIVNGFRNEDGSIEVEGLLPLERNTLDLFIMSQCPFGLSAASQLINYAQGRDDVHFNIHYIFYNTPNGFSAMHGESELMENLVQMSVRDIYGSSYLTYMLLRAEDKAASWQSLASKAGFKKSEIQAIQERIEKERDQLIANEYDYVANQQKITDGSPSYLWEGQKVSDISMLPQFNDLRLELSGNCGN